MSTVRRKVKNVYFTEQYTDSGGSFNDFEVGTAPSFSVSMNNWSVEPFSEMEIWRRDGNNEPRTPGGCTECCRLTTIPNSSNFGRNAYHITLSARWPSSSPGLSEMGSSDSNDRLHSSAFLSRRRWWWLLTTASSNDHPGWDGTKSLRLYPCGPIGGDLRLDAGKQRSFNSYNVISRSSGRDLDIANNSGVTTPTYGGSKDQ
jgi:hypothetical protein